MAKAHVHAASSARRWKGKPEDYMFLHLWMDETKQVVPDNRHRALRHHAEGIFLGARVFGETFENSDGRTVSVRDVLEQHVREDMNGYIPAAIDYFAAMELEPWMCGAPGTHPPSARKPAAARERTREVQLDRD
jgi:hypothetical protein